MQPPISGDARPDDVVRAYADMVYRLAMSHMHNRHDADDVFQDVFFRYLKNTKAFASEAHRKAWLLRVTINACKKRRASAWSRRVVPIENAEALPFADPEDASLFSELAALSADHRAILHLYYYEDLTIEQICDVLRIRPSAAKMRLSRAREHLRRRLKEGFDG